jgi:NADH dehydrogenase FAD-containing subunit
METLPRIVIVGGSFAGYTAALKLAHQLGVGSRNPNAQITVIANRDVFTFSLSLI